MRRIRPPLLPRCCWWRSKKRTWARLRRCCAQYTGELAEGVTGSAGQLMGVAQWGWRHTAGGTPRRHTTPGGGGGDARLGGLPWREVGTTSGTGLAPGRHADLP